MHARALATSGTSPRPSPTARLLLAAFSLPERRVKGQCCLIGADRPLFSCVTFLESKRYPTAVDRNMSSNSYLVALAWPSVSVVGALLVYGYQGFQVGRARHQYGIEPPATTGISPPVLLYLVAAKIA